MTQRSLNLRAAIAAGLSLLGLLLMTRMMGGGGFSAYRFLWVILFGVMTAAGARFGETQLGRGAKAGLLAASTLYLFLQLCGYQIRLNGGTTWTSLALCLGAALCMSPAGAYVLARLAQAGEWTRSEAPGRRRRLFLASFVVILLSWLPVFLAYYPGMFSYDARFQVDQYLAGEITAWQPPLHTIWLGAFYTLGESLGSYTAAFSLHILSQMILMAAIFARAVGYLAEAGVNRTLRLLALAVFALFPVHSILAVSCTKDVLFTGWMTLLAIELHRMITKPEVLKQKRFFAKLAALCVLCCLMRNNAAYSLALLCPFAVLLAKKGGRLRTAALLAVSLVLAFGAYKAVQGNLGEGFMERREKLSIPSQQLARVARNHPDNPYAQEIAAYIPQPELYQPHLADNIKGQLRPETDEAVSEFMALWAKAGKAYPLVYLDAFLLETQGLWWMDDISHSEIYGRGLQNRMGYLSTNTYEGYGIEHVSLLPPLEKIYELLFSANAYQNIPVLSVLFAPALYVWMTAALALRALLKGQRGVLAVCLMLLCYACTLLLGPCVLVRYVYPLIVLAPVLLCLSFGCGKRED